jgi:1,4-dihydroxy-2-naphthoyl-CoA synthase
MPDFTDILYQKHQRPRRRLITINRPDVMNAYLSNADRDARGGEGRSADESVALVITGAGDRAFCAAATSAGYRRFSVEACRRRWTPTPELMTS